MGAQTGIAFLTQSPGVPAATPAAGFSLSFPPLPAGSHSGKGAKPLCQFTEDALWWKGVGLDQRPIQCVLHYLPYFQASEKAELMSEQLQGIGHQRKARDYMVSFSLLCLCPGCHSGGVHNQAPCYCCLVYLTLEGLNSKEHPTLRVHMYCSLLC